MQSPEIESFKPLNPWIHIWFKPRATVRSLLDQTTETSMVVMCILGGIAKMISSASGRSWGDQYAFGEMIGHCLVLGAIAGVISLYLFGFLFSQIGKYMGGTAGFRDVRVAFTWSRVPYVANLFLVWVPMILLAQKDMFSVYTPRLDKSPMIAVFIVLISIVGVTLVCWSFFAFLKCLAEVHQFSVWKSLLCTVIGLVAIVIALSLTVFIFFTIAAA